MFISWCLSKIIPMIEIRDLSICRDKMNGIGPENSTYCPVLSLIQSSLFNWVGYLRHEEMSS